MARFPGALFVGPIPSSNYSANGTPKIGGIVHVIQGSARSALSEFKTPGVQLSAHFIVAGPGDAWPDGTILQVLDTDLVAFAQEAGNWPPIAYTAIEFAGFTTFPMSAAQMASGAAILAWDAKTHGYPLTGPVAHGQPGITSHCNPDGTPDPAFGDHPCPGLIRLAQIPAMIALALNHPTTQEATMNCLDPTSGGTWVVDPSDGHVETLYGAPYCGGLNSPPDADNWQQVGQITGITPWKDPTGAWGYSIIVRHNTALPNGAWFSGYTFPRK